MTSRPLLLTPTLVVLLAACGGGEGTKPTPIDNTPVVTSVTVVPGVVQIEINTTTTLAAQVKDQNGAIMSGKTVTWSSGSPATVTVDGSGVARGVGVGSATISASVDGKTGLSIVNVQPLAVTSVAINPPTAALAGTSFALSAVLKDRNGADLTGRFISWSSSNTRVATIGLSSGNVTALTAGTTTITALSEGVSASYNLVIAAPPGAVAPSISSIAPATLVPGTTATITGANFLATPAQNNVYISGVVASVTAATPTQLTVTVPTTIPCQSTKPVDVEVSTLGGLTSQKQTLRVATSRTMAVGATFTELANSGAIGCNELATNGTYIVSVFNAGRTLTANASFQLNGDAGAGAITSAIPIPTAARTVIPAPAPRPSLVDAATLERVQSHVTHLEESMDLIRRIGIPRRARSASRSLSPTGITAPSRSTVPVPTTVGATATINFHFNACTAASSTPIVARVVYVGTKAIVLEDNASALAGKIDADMIALAKEFEDVSFPLLQAFGDPLAFDVQTDNNGRIIMMFTPKVNDISANLLGFVHSCDLFRPSDDPSVSGSNQAEIFYARAVTDTTAAATSLNGRAQWRRQMPSTVIHETKHIIAFAERFATPVEVTALEATWLEEATAQQASEAYGRAIHGNSWRSNSGYVGTLDCEVRPGTAACGQGNFVMGNHFLFLADFLQNVESKTILSGADDNDIYGSSWLFARWLTDTYGGTNEAAFLQSIVKNYNVIGVDNVTQVTGKTWAELLSQFTLMLAADDLPGVTGPYTEPSWHLPNVFKGYNDDIKNPPPASPLAVRNANFASAFTLSVSPLRGGGAMILKISGSGTSGTQLLSMRGSGGGALNPASTIGIAVMRVQ